MNTQAQINEKNLHDCSNVATGNAVPILHEIYHALQRLISENKETAIDLRALPFAPSEQKWLEQWLGEGEITVSLTALGFSEIKETAVSGVWWLTHYNVANEVIAQCIEITYIPSILLTPKEDVKDSLIELEGKLDKLNRDSVPVPREREQPLFYSDLS